MNHEDLELTLRSETPGRPEHAENPEYTEHLRRADEGRLAHPLAPSEVGSMFAEYRRRQLNIFRERESALELDDSAV